MMGISYLFVFNIGIIIIRKSVVNKQCCCIQMDDDTDGKYYSGLITCLPQGALNSYCILKGTQFSISLLFVILCFFEIYRQIRAYGFSFRWKMISLILMIISLVANMSFCIWNTVYQLYSVQSFVNNLYFLTIVGYVCRMYIVKNNLENKSYVRYGFVACLSLMTMFYSLIMINSIIHENDPQTVNNSCQQIWYLCINLVCLALCVVGLIVLYINQKQEQKRMLAYSFQQSKVNNPLFYLWVWMGLNTLAQVIDLVETGLLINVTQAQSCMLITSSQTGNNVLMFIFAVLTMMGGYAATLWYYATTRKKVEELHSAISSYNQSLSAKKSTNKLYNSGYSEQIKIGQGLEMLDSVTDSLVY